MWKAAISFFCCSDTSYTPTTLKSDVAEPNQVTYTTRFWELPNLARGELAELQHFINQQADKRDNIEKQMHSTFASTLRDIQTKTENLSIVSEEGEETKLIILHLYIGCRYFIKATRNTRKYTLWAYW